MKYTELTIPFSDPTQAEILTALLSDWPFDSFTEEADALHAFIPTEAYASCRGEVEEYLREAGHSFTETDIPETNWNALWESNFEPILVEDRCLIRAPFHPHQPEMEVEVEIMPKMSFGTGHHATTHLMTEEILNGSWEGLSGLDMGSGTGVLAILAAKRGATHLDAIDIDEWAYQNAIENIAANGVTSQVTPLLGDASLLSGRHYDFILANINRNILLTDMEAYVGTLSVGGVLIVSGILEQDITAIVQRAESFGLRAVNQRLRNGWAALRFEFS